MYLARNDFQIVPLDPNILRGILLISWTATGYRSIWFY